MRFTYNSMRCAAAALAAGWMSGSALAGDGPLNDSCETPRLVFCGTTQATNVDATGTFAPSPNCTFGSTVVGKDVYFDFTAPSTGQYTIDTLGSSVDTVLVIRSTACGGAQLACNDDIGSDTDSSVTLNLTAGQQVAIVIGSWANGADGAITLNITCPELTRCCQPWDNGRWDGRTSQTSQIAFGEDWRLVGRVTADDFSLCEGHIYRISGVSGVLLTDAVVPKADVIILDDCDGLPNNIVAAAFSVRPSDIPSSLECLVGDVIISEAGPGPDGLRQIDVFADFDFLFLKGGQYWVVIYGYSGTADPDEQFFWGTSNNQVVRGRPGQFAEIDDLNQIHWTSIDEICCGCTDFNFCVQGEDCKILLDNGGPFTEHSGGLIPGYPSLENHNTASRVRAADNFVVPPCHDLWLCYIEAWVWTNCDTIKLDFLSPSCHCPSEDPPLATFTARCVFDTGITTGIGSTAVTLKKAAFFDFGPLGYRLDANRNYWLSAYAQGDGRQAARSYFSWNAYCDRQCWINFDPACTKGPPYDTSHWQSTAVERGGPGRDLAFLVAVKTPSGDSTDPNGQAGGAPAPTCAADINRDGASTLQDLFDYLAAWFAGCP